MTMEIVVETEVTTNTNTELTDDWPGGMGMLFMRGTLGGVTAKLQIADPTGGLQDMTDWLSGSALSLNALGHGYFNAPKGAKLSVNTSGGTGSDVFIALVPMPTRTQ